MRLAAVLVLIALAPSAAAAAEQVHLGLRDADALAGYTVSWVAPDADGPTGLTFHGANGDVEIEGRLVTGPTIGFVYEARLPALSPGANASYSLGERAFPLRVPQDDASLRVVAIGDMGVTREAGDAVDTIGALSPDLVVHVGDVSYAGGDPTTWKAWFDLVEPVAASAPWIPALGNHEGDVQGLSRDEASIIDPVEQAFFTQRFPLPRDTFWYSYDLVGVHFIALDTFSQPLMPAEEAAWLEADLAAAKDADWIVVYLHEPPYSSNTAHGSSPRAHDAFVATLDAAGVDLVITGHDHHYERTHALRADKIVTEGNETTKGTGTVYLVTGGGGASLYTEFIDAPAWSAYREAAHHVVVLDITRERLIGQAIATDDGRVIDAFTIAREPQPQPEPQAQSVPTPIALAIASIAIAFALRRARRG